MAGFQQAANALTGAIGTVGGRVGVYNELVGKNKEQREQLAKQNEELDKKNEELTKKNEELDLMNSNLISSLELNLKQNELTQHIAKRLSDNARARSSRDRMLNLLYGKKKETTAVPNVKSKEGGK